MNYLHPTEPLWFDRTQDMSGFAQPDITSPPLDEQIDLNFSTAQFENDFSVQISVNSPPEDYILGDPPESLLCEDSNMFDNSNYSALNSKITEWLPKISNMDIDEFTHTNMIDNSGDYLPHIDTENSLVYSQTPKESIKPPATVVEKPRYLSIFDSEEPYIKEEQETLCTENKSIFDPGYDMEEVAEEVVVTTEEDESKELHYLYADSLLDSASLLVDTTTRNAVSPGNSVDLTSPLSRCSAMEKPFDFMDFYDEEDIVKFDSRPPSRTAPRLHLDIEAALVSSAQLLCGSLPDTPEVLKPVLKPEAEFDLVNFLLANGDSNNNAITSTTPTPSSTPRLLERRQGKSHLSLSDLKESQKPRRGKPSPRSYLDPEPTPGPSSATPTRRPPRKSATKFNKMLEEGFLTSSVDSRSVSSDDSDDESSTHKSKRRRSVSTSSRKRLNSDSDLSSICENPSRYRERRDRNNLSSKRSRQKRKVLQEMKKIELIDLEKENKRLKKRAVALERVLQRVHAAWREYLENIKKEH